MKSALTDEDLIRLYFPVKPDYCFDILYRRYYQKTFQQCLHLSQNTEQAQDFSQDVFIKVFQKLGTFQQRSRFSSWIYAITYNYCQDKMRQGARLPTTTISEYLEGTLIDKTESLTYEDRIRRFRLAMDSLSQAEQTLLRLKYEQELSLNEMAGLSGLSVSAVKMRLKRSRNKMKQHYTKQLAD